MISANNLKLSQLAAGCLGDDGYGQGLEFSPNYLKFDCLTLKTTSLRPIEPSRAAVFKRFKSGNYWNWVGLRNPGISNLAKLIDGCWLSACPNLWLSLYADNQQDYCQLIKQADQVANLVGYELNLSCPNLAGSLPKLELDFNNLELASRRPLRYKLAASQTYLINKLAGLANKTLVIGNSKSYRGGGLSGPILAKPHQALIKQVSRRYPTCRLVGVGGIETDNDIQAYLANGASRVQIGSYFRYLGRLD